MRTWARWTARAALLTAGFAAAGVTTAGIASAGVTTGSHSIGGGNQVTAPISVPVSACGNSIALLGGTLAGCQGGAFVSGGSGSWAAKTSGEGSILGGNQVVAPVSVPVSICGNAGAVLGHALAGCAGGASVSSGHGRHGHHCHHGHHSHHSMSATTSGSHSIGGGNQAAIPVRVPVGICGNAVGNAVAACRGGASVSADYSYASVKTSGSHSIGGGNQAFIPVTAPASLCGNAAAVLGGAAAGCAGGASVGAPGTSAHATHTAAFNIHKMARRFTARHMFRRSSSLSAPMTGALASLSKLPVVTSPPAATSASPLTGTLTSATKPIQAHLLSDETTTNSAPGMGSGSLLAIAAGALLAGAAALVAAGRRVSARKAAR
jgi:hypothetical protein